MATFELSAHMTVRPGQLEGFKKQAAEIIRLTREKDTQTSSSSRHPTRSPFARRRDSTTKSISSASCPYCSPCSSPARFWRFALGH